MSFQAVNKDREARIKENIAAIAINAGVLIAEGSLCPDNSATLHAGIVRFAEEFEDLFTEEQLDGDYLGKIDDFAQEKLLGFYGLIPEA